MRRLNGFLVLGLSAVLAATTVAAGPPTEDSGSPFAVGALGVAQVEGRDIFVHVWAVPPPGSNANEVALQALREQGARPVDPRELGSGRYTTTGFTWSRYSDGDPSNDAVVQNYNGSGVPSSVGGAGLTALTNSQVTWTNVATSRFVLQGGGTTTSCPSLVRECPGPQKYDGRNDVAWLALTGCCTLAVTWFGSNEADMALNTRFKWTTSGGTGYDVETVMLHENGHVAGLGHSSDPSAVMYAYYHGVLRQLTQDDKDGLTFLYPCPC